MPLSNRDYARPPHPPACTCVECVVERRHSQENEARKAKDNTAKPSGDAPRYACPYCDRGLIIRLDSVNKARCPNCSGKGYMTRPTHRLPTPSPLAPKPDLNLPLAPQNPAAAEEANPEEWRLPPSAPAPTPAPAANPVPEPKPAEISPPGTNGKVKCPTCVEGLIWPDPDKPKRLCPTCKGSGYRYYHQKPKLPLSAEKPPIKCPDCEDGKILVPYTGRRVFCARCQGSGQIKHPPIAKPETKPANPQPHPSHPSLACPHCLQGYTLHGGRKILCSICQGSGL